MNLGIVTKCIFKSCLKGKVIFRHAFSYKTCSSSCTLVYIKMKCFSYKSRCDLYISRHLKEDSRVLTEDLLCHNSNGSSLTLVNTYSGFRSGLSICFHIYCMLYTSKISMLTVFIMAATYLVSRPLKATDHDDLT